MTAFTDDPDVRSDAPPDVLEPFGEDLVAIPRALLRSWLDKLRRAPRRYDAGDHATAGRQIGEVVSDLRHLVEP